MSAALLAAAAAAVSGDVIFAGASGALGAELVVPLRLRGDVVLALPYARRPQAETLAAADQVLLAITDARLAGRLARGVIASVRCDLEEDPEGRLFTSELAEQELRKHPPSRALIGSLLGRRENWWYVPRLLLHLRLERVVEVAPRSDHDSAVLTWLAEGGLAGTTVATSGWETDRVGVAPLPGSPAAPGRTSASLVATTFSDDFEQQCVAVVSGDLREGAVAVAERRGCRDLPPPPTLRMRLQAQRELARACRSQLRR